MKWLIFFLSAAICGFWFGKIDPSPNPPKILSHIHPDLECPVVEHKSFVIFVYASNCELWCEKALLSVFEQDYDHYRVIFLDDASADRTDEKARKFIADNNQEDKVILIRNETRLGPVASLYRAIDACLDKEIMIPLDGKNWLTSPLILDRLNRVYQNPDVWMTFGQAVEYPSYKIRDNGQTSFYSALFKELKLQDLFAKGSFASDLDSYLTPMLEMSGGRIRKLKEPVAFLNLAPALKEEKSPFPAASKTPLASFPIRQRAKRTDILIFSCDRPLQLYACLESIQRYVAHFENLTVLYKSSDSSFQAGYEKVKEAFPMVSFADQSEGGFKPILEQVVLKSPSEYILFGADDLIVKDFVDLKECMDLMEKTGAYGFYLRLGRHITLNYSSNAPQPLPPSHPLPGGVYAWDFQMGESDWGTPISLDMTLFKKEEIRKTLSQLKYKDPNSLEAAWIKKAPEKKLGLYFERSKLVNIPMNVVGTSGTSHRNYLNTEELLAKFNQGLKIDIDPLYKVENSSPYLDYIPELILR